MNISIITKPRKMKYAISFGMDHQILIINAMCACVKRWFGHASPIHLLLTTCLLSQIKQESAGIDSATNMKPKINYYNIWVLGLTCITHHIFPNVKVTSNKNVHSFWLHFLAWFFMPFHMAGSILLGVLALKTNSIEASDWLLENFLQSESGFWG